MAAALAMATLGGGAISFRILAGFEFCCGFDPCSASYHSLRSSSGEHVFLKATESQIRCLAFAFLARVSYRLPGLLGVPP